MDAPAAPTNLGQKLVLILGGGLGAVVLVVVFGFLAAQSQRKHERNQARMATAVPQDPLAFVDLTLEQALNRASFDRVPVLAVFHDPASTPSQRMNDITWADPEIRTWLQTRTVAIKIDVAREQSLAQRFDIQGPLVMILFTDDGHEIGRLVGYHAAADLITSANKLLSKK